MDRLVAEDTKIRRVLVVDDSPDDRRCLRDRLSSARVAVDEAADGASAIAICLSRPPDLVLLDLGLPDCNGIDLLTRLKRDPATRTVPVIVVSGMSSTDQKVRGLESGAVDFITKPYDAVELRARVGSALRMKATRELLEHRAYFDSLTGLANRTALDERMRAEWAQHLRRRTPLSFLMGDLDHFKQINDRYGHTAGDAVLREVAERVRACVRDTDFAARFGGEEIVVIAPACDDQGARLIAERLRAGVCARPIGQGKSSMIVTMSIGLATADDMYRPTNVATLVERADAALYNAKAAGRNQVCAWRDRLASAGTERGGGPVLLALPKHTPEPS